MFLLLSFIVYFSEYMKDEVKIYDKLDKTIIKNLLFQLFLNVRTLSTKTTILKKQLLFYITNKATT